MSSNLTISLFWLIAVYMSVISYHEAKLLGFQEGSNNWWKSSIMSIKIIREYETLICSAMWLMLDYKCPVWAVGNSGYDKHWNYAPVQTSPR